MQLKRDFNLIVFVGGICTLFACGGGGGKSSNNQPQIPPEVEQPPATISISGPSTISIAEHQTQTLQLSTDYSGSQPVNISFSDISDEIEISGTKTETGYELTLSVGELLGELNDEFTAVITLSDGATSQSSTIVISTINQSLADKFEEIEETIKSIQAYSSSVELSNLGTYLIDRAYLNNQISYEESQSLHPKLIELTQTATEAALLAATQTYSSILTKMDEVSESESLSLLLKVNEDLINSKAAYSNLLVEYNNLSIPAMPVFLDIFLSEYNGAYSLFYSNPNYGEWVNETWQFHSEWAFLTKLLPSNISSCSVESDS
ncbi:hypothetical protein [Paraglaciecola sp.]|uniref:hypothetical protein n=1 Tax=Paraglaciecola sp. TaxID=1920173 RepID=UPI00273EC0E0|nr:hypothetical protein [Paraglaciecola sp.]MDP5032509.1 hypothetical protein [Paraglaciecola sp.]